ncbi:MAG: transcriptional regulator, partial [Chloroflexota bacterium]
EYYYYDHLAGRLGVSLTAALIERDILAARDGVFLLTDSGEGWLIEFGIPVPTLRTGHRPLTRICIDWSEQLPHLAGALGAALTERLFELEWVRRSPSTRAVQVTEAGYANLVSRLGLDMH